MSAAAPASGSWADVLGEGRLPRFTLICLGVWLNAADSLITATIMPSVGRSLGGYVYFGWATAGYLLASVLAGASSGVLALRFGLRSATAAAALLYAGGCALSALAPEIFTLPRRAHPARIWRWLGRRPVLDRHRPAVRQSPAAACLQRSQLGLGDRGSDWAAAGRRVRRRRFLARGVLGLRNPGNRP